MQDRTLYRFFAILAIILMMCSLIHPEGWKQLDVTNIPCSGMAYTYDEFRKVGIILGGDTPEIVNNTYEWNGVDWILKTSIGPSARTNASMAFDTLTKRAVLFGGWCTPDEYYDDTWEWNGNQWQQIVVSGPSSRANCAIAYDKNRNKVVLFGGSYYQSIYGDTWEYDGTTQSWSQVSTSGPSQRIFSRMVYDENREVIVLFGGESTYYDDIGFNDLWEWDGIEWKSINAEGPSARTMHAMVYNPIRKSIILFGGGGWGSGPVLTNDLWELKDTTWERIDEYGPSERENSCMFFDETRNSLIMMGGTNDDISIFGDTWEYSFLNYGLVAYYPFNGNANDESGNENHGDTTSHSPLLCVDRNGNDNQAYYFNGESYITISKPLGSFSSLTLTAWINTSSDSYDQTIIERGGWDYSGSGEFALIVNEWPNYTGKARFQAYDLSNRYIDSDISVNDGLWHYLAGTWDGDSIKLYIDSELVGSSFSTGTVLSDDEAIIIGSRYGNSEFFIGSIDEVSIYNRALTELEIQKIYHEGGIVSIKDTPEHIAQNPDKISLSQSYPNPFNPTTMIKYTVLKESYVRIDIYDLNGRVVEHLVDRRMTPGEYSISWDAANFGSGIYFYRIQAGDFSEVRKCVLIK